MKKAKIWQKLFERILILNPLQLLKPWDFAIQYLVKLPFMVILAKKICLGKKSRKQNNIYFFTPLEARRSIISCAAFSVLVIITEVSFAKIYIITIFLSSS